MTTSTSRSSSPSTGAADLARRQAEQRAEARRAHQAAAQQAAQPRQQKAATIPDGFSDSKVGTSLELDTAAARPTKQAVFTDGFEVPGKAPVALVPPLTPTKVTGEASLTVGTDGQVTVEASGGLAPDSVTGTNGNLTGKVAAGPMAETSVSLSWNPLEQNDDGTYDVTVSIGAKTGSAVSGELPVGALGVEAEAKSGSTTEATYEVKLTAAELAGVAAGTHPLPTLADPMSLDEGESLTMSTGSFEAASGKVSYGPLSIGSETTSSEDYSVAVERTGESTVRVTVGPSDTIKRSLELGVSFGDVASAGLTGSTSLEHSKLASVEFDLATPEGKAAYDEFLRSGALPTAEGPGITDSYSEETLGSSSSLGGHVELGDVLKVEHEFWKEGLSYTRRVEDGVATITAKGETRTGNEFTVAYAENPDGSATLKSVSIDTSSGVAGDATITLTGEEGVRSLQDVAFKQAQGAVIDAVRQSDLATSGMTDAEVRQYVIDNYPEGARARALLESQPGDEGFTYQKWLETYDTYDPSRAWPVLPNLTHELLRMGDPDLSLAADLVMGLGGLSPLNDLLAPQGVTSYAELGADALPGVDITPK
ncbi:MAG: hypothetical protein IT380_12960 [Myxococcales bacterium]|nr:hypothetical protein [Myxococcales bacterium]